LLQGPFQPDFFDGLKKSKSKNVFLLEGRPTLENARATVKELLKRKVKPTLISDNMAGFLFSKKMVKEVHIAYQSADEKGAVCSIGGLILAVLGKKHKVPVHCIKGKNGFKAMGRQKDLLEFNGQRVAPLGIKGYVPLMEFVPKKYISRIT